MKAKARIVNIPATSRVCYPDIFGINHPDPYIAIRSSLHAYIEDKLDGIPEVLSKEKAIDEICSLILRHSLEIINIINTEYEKPDAS